MKNSFIFGIEDLLKNKLKWFMVFLSLTTIMITFINSTNSMLWSNQYHAYDYTWQNPSAILVSKDIQSKVENRNMVKNLLQTEAFSFIQSNGYTQEFETDVFYLIGNLPEYFPGFSETEGL